MMRRTLNRRTVLKGAAAASGVVFLPSLGFAADQPRKGGTLRVGQPYNPAAIDPMTGRNLPDLNVLYACYDGLIDFNPSTLELKPGLAKAWAFKDPKTLVLDLLDGIEFHDGTPFNAEAVKFNLDRYRSDQRSNVKSDLNVVADVEVTGKSQVTLHLSRPNAGLPAILTTRVGLMVSPKSIKEKGPNVDRIAGRHRPVQVRRVAGQFELHPDAERQILEIGPALSRRHQDHASSTSSTPLVRTTMAGETDIALNLQVPQKLIADRDKKLVIQTGPSLVFGGIFMNYARAPLNDVRIRQALNYAIDRNELNKVLVAGLGEPSCTILPKEHWAVDPSTIDYYKHDPDKAKALLEGGGLCRRHRAADPLAGPTRCRCSARN